ncbi:MAG: DTW domain-containing protein [Proteobacteria bacterium]|nr:DTW domain-containing protein [Pseudomonadota bacterium]
MCPQAQSRPTCYRCFKPEFLCVCGSLEAIPNAVRVHVLQHPRERHHPIGTARLLRLGLQSVRVHVLELVGRGGESKPAALPPGAGLLYPSADARDLSVLPADERPEHLVVIDGTWSHAHQVHRDNPWISELPRYSLPEGEESRYRIRAEPRPECLSTVESVVRALRFLQPDLAGTDSLLAAFDAMIDAQIEASRRPSRHSVRKVRRGPSRAVPNALKGPPDQIIALYTEWAPPPRGLLRVSAVTLDGGRVFDRIVQTECPPDAFHTELLGLAEDALEAALPQADVLEELGRFCAGAQVLTWEPRVLRWLQTSRPELSSLLLKGVWGNVSSKAVPALDRVVGELGLTVRPGPVTGRAGTRLMLACAMIDHLRSLKPERV